MGLKVTIVSGPRRSGKTTVIRLIIDEVCDNQPHFIRLAAKQSDKKAPTAAPHPNADCGVATATWLTYDPVRIFEVLPEALTAIHKRDRYGCVIMEADADPDLRNAYPYDCSIFVMPAPESIEQVFRTKAQASHALQNVLNDTAAFAKEIYGLFSADESESDQRDKSRDDMSDSQVFHFLHSPLGQEVATRIQCQPEYHGVVEADVVVVNMGVGGVGPAVDDVVARLEKLVHRSRPGLPHKPVIFCCDPTDPKDPRRNRLLEHLSESFAHRE